MACWIRCNLDTVYRMRGIEIDCFNQRERGQVILLGIEGGALI
jgi:hypothetical protein